MIFTRQLRSKRATRKLGADVAVMVGVDWLNGKASKARKRVTTLIEELQKAEVLSKRLRTIGQRQSSESSEIRQLHTALEEADRVLANYRGTRVLWINNDYTILELFGFNRKRLETDEAYYQETRLVNYVLELLRDGSIGNLRKCRECHGWYYAVTDHQTFCTARCRQSHASHSPSFQENRRKYMKAYRKAEKMRDKRTRQLARQ